MTDTDTRDVEGLVRRLEVAMGLIARRERELADALKILEFYGYNAERIECSICGDYMIGGMVGDSVFAPNKKWRHPECDENGDRRPAALRARGHSS